MPICMNLLCHGQTGTNEAFRKGYDAIKWKEDNHVCPKCWKRSIPKCLRSTSHQKLGTHSWLGKLELQCSLCGQKWATKEVDF